MCVWGGSECGWTVALPARMDGWMVTAAFVALVQVPPPPPRGHEHGATSALMLPGRQRRV